MMLLSSLCTLMKEEDSDGAEDFGAVIGDVSGQESGDDMDEAKAGAKRKASVLLLLTLAPMTDDCMQRVSGGSTASKSKKKAKVDSDDD